MGTRMADILVRYLEYWEYRGLTPDSTSADADEYWLCDEILPGTDPKKDPKKFPFSPLHVFVERDWE